MNITAGAPAAPAAVSVPFLMTMMLVSIFAASIYLPSLPRIASEFAASPAAAQASLTAFVVTFGLMQLWHGPASDRLGRWRVLRLSLVVFLIGTAACALAPTLEILIAGRVFQGLGAAGIAVLPRAIAQDAYGSTPRGTQVFVYLSMAAALSAAIAPLLGGWLDSVTDSWQASFVLLGVLGVGVLAMAARGAGQLAGASMDRPAGLRGVARDWLTLMGHRNFAFSVMGGGAMRAGFFGVLTALPFLLTEAFGIGGSAAPVLIGALMAALTLSFLAANIVVSRLIKRFSPQALSVWGAVISLLAPAAMAIAAQADADVVFGLAVPLALFGFGQGFCVPMSNILAVRTDPQMAGTAASLLGFWTHMLGAAGTLAASALSYRDTLPLAGLIGIAVLVALACFLGLLPKRRAAAT